jgi:hypothetical protein
MCKVELRERFIIQDDTADHKETLTTLTVEFKNLTKGLTNPTKRLTNLTVIFTSLLLVSGECFLRNDL